MAESSQRDTRVVTLTKDNYVRCRTEIEDALRGHGLYWVASGKDKVVAEPAEEVSGYADKLKAFRDFDEKDSKARSIIRRTLDDISFCHVQDLKSSKEILDRIKELRNPQSTDILMDTITAFFSETWLSDDDVSSFMARLNVHAIKVNDFKSDDAKISDKFIMGKVLASVPSQFGNFKQTWNLLAKTDSKLTDFREKLLAAERQMTTDGNNAATHASGGDALYVKPKLKKFSGKFEGDCHFCGKKGHKQTDCRKRLNESGRDSKCEKKSEKKKAEALSVFVAQSCSTTRIVADSGASRHLTGNKHWFRSLKKLDTPIEFTAANGSLTATHEGDISVSGSVDGKQWRPLVWQNVLYVPGLSHTLLSTTFLEDKGFSFEHGNNRMQLKRGGKVIIGGNRVGSSYEPCTTCTTFTR